MVLLLLSAEYFYSVQQTWGDQGVEWGQSPVLYLRCHR